MFSAFANMILSSSAGLLLKINLSTIAFGVTAWFLLVQGWFLTRATALISYQLTASAAAFCTCRLCPCNRSPSSAHQPGCAKAAPSASPLCGLEISASGIEIFDFLVLTEKASRTHRSYSKIHPKGLIWAAALWCTPGHPQTLIAMATI